MSEVTGDWHLGEVFINGKIGASGTVHGSESSQEHVAISLSGLEQYIQRTATGRRFKWEFISEIQVIN